MQSLRHLVVGTDFSACSESALECAITLAKLGLARITVVHVCELSNELGDSVQASDFDDAILRTCTEQLAAIVSRRARCGVDVKGLLRTGKPWEKLNNAATEVGASLIVIGRHGTSVTPTIGSVATHVLRTATRPVLVVGPGDIVMTRHDAQPAGGAL
jgi:universal stress protein E